MSGAIRVLLADDHSVFRSGVRALLDREHGITVVAEAGSGHEALKMLMEHEVDVLLLDLSMPGGISGPQIAEAALADHPALGIVVLSMHEDEYYLREMFLVGARGYVLKKSDAADVVRAIRAVAGGAHYIDPALAGHMVGDYLRKSAPGAGMRAATLTLREQEVCRLLAMGHTNAEVAEQLVISQRTVETHRAKVMAKLGLQTRAELVRFALDNGLLKG
jgi:DNA-binding NarL/FixJ family response regulator